MVPEEELVPSAVEAEGAQESVQLAELSVAEEGHKPLRKTMRSPSQSVPSYCPVPKGRKRKGEESRGRGEGATR